MVSSEEKKRVSNGRDQQKGKRKRNSGGRMPSELRPRPTIADGSTITFLANLGVKTIRADASDLGMLECTRNPLSTFVSHTSTEDEWKPNSITSCTLSQVLSHLRILPDSSLRSRHESSKSHCILSETSRWKLTKCKSISSRIAMACSKCSDALIFGCAGWNAISMTTRCCCRCCSCCLSPFLSSLLHLSHPFSPLPVRQLWWLHATLSVGPLLFASVVLLSTRIHHDPFHHDMCLFDTSRCWHIRFLVSSSLHCPGALFSSCSSRSS